MPTFENTLNDQGLILLQVERFEINIPEECRGEFGNFRRHGKRAVNSEKLAVSSESCPQIHADGPSSPEATQGTPQIGRGRRVLGSSFFVLGWRVFTAEAVRIDHFFHKIGLSGMGAQVDAV
jgi:hypothetical protein